MNPAEFVKVLTQLRSKATGGDGMYLTPDQLVERWNGAITKGTLANWRSKKKGPSFTKMGEKVLYPIDKLEKWEASQLTNIGANDNNQLGAVNAAS
jgi:hypothetical protein